MYPKNKKLGLVAFHGIFRRNWYKLAIWWAPRRTYLRFIITVSVPRKLIPHKNDGYGICCYCKRKKWIEDIILQHKCAKCIDWIERVEEEMQNEFASNLELAKVRRTWKTRIAAQA